MFSFFRRLRVALLESGNTRKYIVYAFGEITIIVVGIMIALYLQNWNENRIRKQNFNQLLDQLYNSIQIDTWSKKFMNVNFQDVEGVVLQLLNEPDSIEDQKLITMLYYVDKLDLILQSDTRYLLSLAELNPNDIRQNELLKEIYSFSSFSNINQDQYTTDISDFLSDAGLPKPGLTIGFSGPDILNFNLVGKNPDEVYDLYTVNEIKQARQLLKEDRLQSLLRAKLSQIYLLKQLNDQTISDAQSILYKIREYYPDARLLFDDMGILGTALEQGFNKSVPMELVDTENGIWQLNLTLNDGLIKFRTRDSWANNWGGRQFPEGGLIYFGGDIPVKAGTYKVTVNLSEQKYSFEPVETSN